MKQTAFRPGFTIVELLLVIVIIAILAAIVTVAYNGIRSQAVDAAIKTDLKNASTHLASYYSLQGSYPADDSAFPKSDGTTYTYHQTDSTTFCLEASSGARVWHMTQTKLLEEGACPTSTVPEGYETAPVASGASIDIGGYNPIQPATCPGEGGSWIKVPGSILYGVPNGFCVQQYPANNVGGVATSQAAGPRWTALTQAVAKTTAEAVTSGAHLLSEAEWMTIAANAAMQTPNWSGGSVGSGTLPRGSSTAGYGTVAIRLSNGETMYFDTGSSTGRASNEWTCYTGSNASNCGLAAQYHPTPNNAYHTDQFTFFTGYGSFTVDGSGRYYGDPRYANPSLGAFITSARDKGLGYLRSSYAAGSSSVYGFNRGSWTGATSSGLFTAYIYTLQASYAHSTYGFRAAK